MIQIAVFLCTISIQFILIKISSGKFVLYTYTNESFEYLLMPKVQELLFSIGKGFFMFLPVLFIGFLSMFLNANRELKFAQPAVFACAVYIISSWWCWFGGGNFSIRFLCDYLCLFIVPFSAFYDSVFKALKKPEQKKVAIILLCFSVLFTVVNYKLMCSNDCGIHILNPNVFSKHLFR